MSPPCSSFWSDVPVALSFLSFQWSFRALCLASAISTWPLSVSCVGSMFTRSTETDLCSPFWSNFSVLLLTDRTVYGPVVFAGNLYRGSSAWLSLTVFVDYSGLSK